MKREKRNSKKMKRIIGMLLSLVVAGSSVPMDVYAANLEIEKAAYESSSDRDKGKETADEFQDLKEKNNDNPNSEEDYIMENEGVADASPEETMDATDGLDDFETDKLQSSQMSVNGRSESIVLYSAVSGEFTYTVTDDMATITKYGGTEEIVSIPDTLDGYSVVSIGAGAFRGNDKIKEVTIPSTVISIEGATFRDCSVLNKVHMSQALTTLGDYAFYACSALTDIDLPATLTDIGRNAFGSAAGLTEITIPAGVTSIGSYAFNDSVKKITFAEGTTEIVEKACYGASLLETVVIPSTVTKIGKHVFYQCSELKNVTLPVLLTGIGDYAFYACSALTDIDLPATLTDIGRNAFGSAAGLTEITIPAGVTSIGSYAFNDSVKKITFAEGTTEIVEKACYGASLLETVVIPSTVTKIGKHAFYQCGELKNVTLPVLLTGIGDYAFYACSALTDIDLPAALTNIGNSAFSNCSLLTDITLPSSLTTIGSNVFNGAVSMNELIIPVSLTNIEAQAFSNSVKKIIFAEGTTEIVSKACYGASLLEEVVMPDTVTVIGKQAFYRCQNLLNINLSESITIIGESAFYQCTNLISVILPEGLKEIQTSSFHDCIGMEYVLIPTSIEIIGQKAFYNAVKSIIFAEGLKAIPAYACYEATNLTEVVLPESVVSIGNKAFYNCKLLREITIPEGTTTIEAYAFYSDSDLRVYVPDTLVDVAPTAFSGCKLVKPCGNNAEFEYDFDTQCATVSGSGIIGDSTGNVFKPYDQVIQFVEIGDGITGISDRSFENMGELIGVVIEDNVRQIGIEAFNNCHKLEYVEFSKNIEKIEEKAFQGCDYMNTVIFTGSFPQIDQTAFPKKNLTVYYPKTDLSYTDGNKEQFTSFSWKEWDDTLPERDIVLVLDVSGSMSGERIANLKEAVISFSEKVGGRISNTRISIVAFADEAKKLMGFSTDVVRMKLSTERLTAGGGTRYLEGLEDAENLLAMSDSSLKSVILFSDGSPGDSQSKIKEKVQEFRDNGYYTYSVGLMPTELCRQLLIEIAGDEENYFEAENIDYLIDSFVEASEGIGRSGICGDNVKWKYSNPKKQLSLIYDKNKDGLGRVDDFNSETPAPWSVYAQSIETVSIEDGITYVGKNSFQGLSNVTSIQLANTVKEVGDEAFSDCINLKNIYYAGTKEEFKTIIIGNKNDPFKNANIFYGCKNEAAAAQPVKVTSVTITPEKLEMAVGDEATLNAEIAPKNATNKVLSWESSDPSVVSIGNTGRVKALSVGTANITAKSSDGGFVAVCRVTVSNDIPVIKKLEFGNIFTNIEVDEDIPILGGKTFNIDLPVDLPVSCAVEDNKIKVGINIKKENLYSYNSAEGVTTTTGEKKTIKEEFEEFLTDAYRADLMLRDEKWLDNIQDEKFLKANIPGIDTAVDFNCVGYAEGGWDKEAGAQTIQGTVVVTIEGAATAQTQMVVWVIPVTVNCTFTASGSVSATVGYNFSEAKWYGDLELAFALGIEPYAGVGFGQWVSGGVYGKAETQFNIVALSSRKKPGLETWTLNGEIGIKGYFAKKSATIALLSPDEPWEIYPGKNKASSIKQINNQLLNNNNLWGRELVVTTLPETSGVQSTTISNNGIFVSDAYNAANPSLAITDDVTMLVYVVDDGNRNTLNQTKLVYSIFDYNTNTYDEAVSVLDNGTADCEPKVITAGEDIYVTWMDSAKIFGETEDSDLMDYMKTFSPRVAKYNKNTQTFEDLGSPGENENYKYAHGLYFLDGQLQLVWVENPDNQLFGLSNNNIIRRAVYEGNQWKPADEIGQLNAVTSVVLGDLSSGEGTVLGFATDKDNDLTTKEQELYLKSAEAGLHKANGGEITNLLFTQLPGVEGNVLAANVNGGLSYFKEGKFHQLLPEGTMNVDSGFQVSGNHIMYLKSEGESRNIGISIYDDGRWGSTRLTREEGYVDFFTYAKGKITYLSANATHGNDTINVASDIKYMESVSYNDVELEGVDFAPGDIYAGGKLPLELYIQNNGTSRVEKIQASVTYEGVEISSADINIDILPGEVEISDYIFDLPQKFEGDGEFTVTVSVMDDIISDNNSEILPLKKAELEVKSSYDNTGENPYINVTIENSGVIDSSMVMDITDEDGKLLFQESSMVKAGSTITYKKEFKSEKDQTLLLNVVSESDEFYKMNNSTLQYVGKWQGPAGTPVHKAFSVGFKDVSSDPYEGIYYNEMKDRYETMFTGDAVKPEVIVTGLQGELIEGIDYTIKYSNNTKVPKKEKPATIIVTGKGNYVGKYVLNFYLMKPDLSVAKEKGLLVMADEIKTQSGKKLSPVIAYGSYILKASDLDISHKTIIKGNTQVDIGGKGNFTGKLENINVKAVSGEEMKANKIKVALKAEKHIYNGKPHTLENELVVTAGKNKTPLIEGIDYVVRYSSNISSGKAKATIIGVGDYTGGISKSFKIMTDTVSTIIAQPQQTEVEYNPEGAAPVIDVYISGMETSNEKLILGKDYTISYSKNKRVGTGVYTVKFCGNYKGHRPLKNQKYEIIPASFENVFAISMDKIYTKPGKYLSAPSVIADGVKLTTKDYTVKYYDGTKEITGKDKIIFDNGIDSKIITVTIKGKGNYQSQEIRTSYTVFKENNAQFNLSKARIVAKEKVNGKDVKVGKLEYTGEALNPEIRVLVKEGKVWKEVPASAYSVNYYNNIKKGKAEILIEGNGVEAISGQMTKFSVSAKQLNLFERLTKVK